MVLEGVNGFKVDSFIDPDSAVQYFKSGLYDLLQILNEINGSKLDHIIQVDLFHAYSWHSNFFENVRRYHNSRWILRYPGLYVNLINRILEVCS
jgi:hypothetical protein